MCGAQTCFLGLQLFTSHGNRRREMHCRLPCESVSRRIIPTLTEAKERNLALTRSCRRRTITQGVWTGRRRESHSGDRSCTAGKLRSANSKEKPRTVWKTRICAFLSHRFLFLLEIFLTTIIYINNILHIHGLAKPDLSQDHGN